MNDQMAEKLDMKELDSIYDAEKKQKD